MSNRAGWITGLLVLGLLAVAAGVTSAWWTVHARGLQPHVSVGPWRADLLAGSASANAYTRARIAIIGLLALQREETMYYVAGSDDRGHALTGDCDYRIEGRSPSARWWSITAYGEDYFLIPNPERRYSFTMRSAEPDSTGHFAFVASSQAQAGRWLPLGGAPRVFLNLRLYNPGPELAQHPEALDAPHIIPLGACP